MIRRWPLLAVLLAFVVGCDHTSKHLAQRHLADRSAVDVVPTVFTYMGAKNPLSDYTQGVPLTALDGPEYVVVAGWGDAGLVDRDAITHFGFRTVVRDHEYNVLPDQPAERSKRAKWYSEVLEAQRQFVK